MSQKIETDLANFLALNVLKTISAIHPRGIALYAGDFDEQMGVLVKSFVETLRASGLFRPEKVAVKQCELWRKNFIENYTRFAPYVDFPEWTAQPPLPRKKKITAPPAD